MKKAIRANKLSSEFLLAYIFLDRRNNNPFTAYKIRFKNNQYLPKYAGMLINMVVKYQLGKITEIKDYTGEKQSFLAIELKRIMGLLKSNGIILLKI